MKVAVAAAIIGASLLSRLTNGAAVALVLASVALVVASIALWRSGSAARTVYKAIDKQTGRIKPAALDDDHRS